MFWLQMATDWLLINQQAFANGQHRDIADILLSPSVHCHNIIVHDCGKCLMTFILSHCVDQFVRLLRNHFVFRHFFVSFQHNPHPNPKTGHFLCWLLILFRFKLSLTLRIDEFSCFLSLKLDLKSVFEQNSPHNEALFYLSFFGVIF